MQTNNASQQLLEEIKLFIQYSVSEEEFRQAVELLNRYQNNSFVTRLLAEYYRRLPEAREEAVIRVARFLDRQGVQLLVLSTASFSYLYAVSSDNVLLLGEYGKEVDDEVLAFLGMKSQESFLKTCPPLDELEEYGVDEEQEKDHCPVCAVAEGDCHLLGCSVEICPWCSGQLSNCNCRFEQLETDSITEEEQLEIFIELLEAKGRVVYQKNQAPAFPGTSGGLDDSQAT